MPEVDVRPHIEEIFTRALQEAQKVYLDDQKIPHRQILIITPGRLLIAKTCPVVEDFSADHLNKLNELLPVVPKKKIAVIAYTYLEALQADMRKAIPFIDILMGFCALGHDVWIFEGHPSAFKAGCAGADLLLVDAAMQPFISLNNPDWRDIAMEIMPMGSIKIIARS